MVIRVYTGIEDIDNMQITLVDEVGETSEDLLRG